MVLSLLLQTVAPGKYIHLHGTILAQLNTEQRQCDPRQYREYVLDLNRVPGNNYEICYYQISCDDL